MANIFQLTAESPRIRNLLVRQFISECVGTFILLLMGTAISAQHVLSRNQAGSPPTVMLGWGFAIMVAVHYSWGVSGAHLNPAVSLGMLSVGKFPLYKLPVYVAAQMLGAFLGGALACAMYIDSLYNFDGGVRTITGPNGTGGIFTTFPQEWVSVGNAFLDQVIGTAMLEAGVLAVIDKNNGDAPSGMMPFLLGILVAVIIGGMSFNCGAAINPARDLGPRIFLAISGWGTEAFSFRDYTWFWVPIVGPLVGGVVGAQFYYWLLERHHPALYEGVEDGKSIDKYERLQPDDDQRTGNFDSRYASTEDTNLTGGSKEQARYGTSQT